MDQAAHRIREINPQSSAEIELVATRMRETLIEVLGEEAGGNMYPLEWLIQRVRFHLDPSQCAGQVFVSENREGKITGHTIVRIERGEDGHEFGLFSTFYVEPGSRNQAIATNFVRRGEQWMRELGMTTAMTYTAADNLKLQKLMIGLGYEIVLRKDTMVALSKTL